MSTAEQTRSLPLHDPSWWAGDFWDDLAWLRAHDPVHRVQTPAGPFWALARHADVLAVSRDPETWRSGHGVLIDDLRRTVAGNESVIYLDPPEHARQRTLVSRWFRPRTVAAFEERVRERARALLDEVPLGDVIDANEALAIPLPIRVIADMLGVPESDQASFREWSDRVIEAGSSQQVTDETAAGLLELYRYFGDQLDRRRREPGDDLVTELVQAEDADGLSRADALAFCMTLLVAGNETTRNLLANGLIALAEHPDQWERLRSEPALVAPAVEELLRWVTPVLHFSRTATSSTAIGGQRVEAGEMVVMLYASANRDEDVFGPTATALDLGREPNHHVAFGFGEHFCLGAQLARLEARIFLVELIARVERIEVAGDVVRKRSNLMRGLDALPMQLHPAT